MNDDPVLRNRDIAGANVDLPAADPRAPQHEEWMLDEAIEETFPASDAPTPSRPGSLAALRYGRAASRSRVRLGAATARIFLLAASAVLLGVLVQKIRGTARRPRDH
jgi:hypothetical protein